ncbi:MAG TPA: asparagine synthase (glutamine-hydrolyzing) [Acidimicrobiales bacterium]|nr:asparagine synthase (glutamine-hydrolyzing) [Acidimicrobiales bacterium]
MCGIAGSVSSVRSHEATVTRMLRRLEHRGPDGEGVWTDGLCTLGHRRLAVIDLSDAARQPMSNERRDIWLTYNGEIYNFRQLRKELVHLGHTFQSVSDSEVIVHGYEEWGSGVVERLAGMFAFGLWDARRKRLLLARDRLGKKPLFFSRLPKGIVFASELDALLAVPEVRRTPNSQAIDAYLSLRYVPGRLSAFQGVERLMPAETLLGDWSRPVPEFSLHQYWRPTGTPPATLTFQDAVELTREHVRRAVAARLVSDVPLGAFLSGGVDSSIIVSQMAELGPTRPKTFSIGFDVANFDELHHARRIAQHFATDHHEFVVSPNAIELVPRLVRHYGEPYGDSSALPTYYVSQQTRHHVTVALSGDGGDETFGGYDRYVAVLLAERARPVARASRRLGGSTVLHTAGRIMPRLSRVSRFFDAAGLASEARYRRWMTDFTLVDKAHLYSPEFAESIDTTWADSWISSIQEAALGSDAVESAMRTDLVTYLPYDILTKVDIASMANSLEVRAPFLDHELVEFACSLPRKYKIRGLEKKRVLKAAFRHTVPIENLRRAKMGFGVPIGAWFRGELSGVLRGVLLSDTHLRRGYFRPDAVRRLVDEHQSGSGDHTHKLWALYMLEMWHQEMVEPK